MVLRRPVLVCRSLAGYDRETGDKRIVSDFYEALSLYINSLLVAVQSTGIGNMFYQ